MGDVSVLNGVHSAGPYTVSTDDLKAFGNDQAHSQHGANTSNTQETPVPARQDPDIQTSHRYRPIKLKEEPVENFRPLRVICIGAGYSGIYMAIRIPEWLRNVDLTVYDKNADIGGTWYENRYPGCACDIPGKSTN